MVQTCIILRHTLLILVKSATYQSQSVNEFLFRVMVALDVWSVSDERNEIESRRASGECLYFASTTLCVYSVGNFIVTDSVANIINFRERSVQADRSTWAVRSPYISQLAGQPRRRSTSSLRSSRDGSNR